MILRLQGSSDEDPVAGSCLHDLPLGAAMAEKGSEGGRFREFEYLHPGLAVTVENNDARAAVMSACRGSGGRPRWRLGIFVWTHSCSSTKIEARTVPVSVDIGVLLCG